MQWLGKNWFWVLIAVVFVGAHLFGHSGHSGQHSSSPDDKSPSTDYQH